MLWQLNRLHFTVVSGRCTHQPKEKGSGFVGPLVLVWGFCIYIDRYLKAMLVDSCILEHGTLYGFMQVRTDHQEHRAWRLIWHAALFFFCLPKIPILSFANKSITSHTWVSLDWQHHASRLFRASVKQFSCIEKCTYLGTLENLF